MIHHDPQWSTYDPPWPWVTPRYLVISYQLPTPLRCALLWMLGEYGQKIPESPYLIEPMIDSFAEEVSQVLRAAP